MRAVSAVTCAAVTLSAALGPCAARSLPPLSYGTGSSTKERDDVAALTAIWLRDVGGTGVDTAFVYRDEDQVGNGLRESGVPRDAVFLTTKVMCVGGAQAQADAKTNLEQLGVGAVDLLLIHTQCESASRLATTWASLEAEVAAGRARAAGVSNFELAELQRLVKLGGRPAVNQILMHVGRMPSEELVAFARANGVTLEAYSPLGKGAVLKLPVVKRVAAEHGRSAAQVALQYLLQKGHKAVFTSSKERYMRENLAVLGADKFELSAEEMAALDAVTPAELEQVAASE